MGGLPISQGRLRTPRHWWDFPRVVTIPLGVKSMPKHPLILLFLLAVSAFAQTQPPSFNGVDQWKRALVSGDAASLKSLYSANPPARTIGKDGKPTADIAPESDFWSMQLANG